MSRIIESNKITDVLNYITPKSLVLFDIDNTLIESIHEFGGHAWFLFMVERFKEQGLQEPVAIKKSSATFTQMQDVLTFKTVESETITVLDQLKTKNIKAMAVTARWIALAQSTFRHLESLKISFHNNVLHDEEMSLGEISGFSKGILFTGDENEKLKGEFLISFFEKIGYTPEHVVFVDDSMKQVEHVYKTLQEKNIACHCIRYGATDSRMNQFDPARAQNELLQVVGAQRYKSIFEEVL